MPFSRPWSIAAAAAATVAVVVGVGVTLSLASCASQTDVAPDEAPAGVPVGATKEEYAAAFEDVDPLTLRMMANLPQGAPGNQSRELYAEALDEWSGGKITVEIGYSNSFVPNSADWAAALADGRLDLGEVLPSTAAEVFPLNAQVSDASILNGSRPADTLVNSGWVAETFAANPDFADEYATEGIHVLVPAMPTSSPTGLFCTEPATSLSDLSQLPISVSGRGKTLQVEALGGVPVSMPHTDQYEAVERSVIDCAATSPQSVQTLGLAPIVPYAVLDSKASMAAATAAFGVGSIWDELPLVAQQLLFDRLDVLLPNEATTRAIRVRDVAAELEENGGGFVEFSADAREALLDANEGLLGELSAGGADVDAFQTAHDEWAEIVFDDLGVYDGTDYAAFVDGLEPEEWSARVLETMAGLRP